MHACLVFLSMARQACIGQLAKTVTNWQENDLSFRYIIGNRVPSEQIVLSSIFEILTMVMIIIQPVPWSSLHATPLTVLPSICLCV